MTNLNPEICRKLRAARRAAKLSQMELAAEIGCKQSALSMFEQGDGTKLNDEAVEKIAKKFGIDIVEKVDTPLRDHSPVFSVYEPSSPIRGFCPNPHCPTNRVYEVEGKTYCKPDRPSADPVGGRFCAMCGENLIKECPNCGAPVHDGGFCSNCGDPYIAMR